MEHSINISSVHIYIHYIFNQADNAIIEMKNPKHFGWMFNGTRYRAIVRDNPVAQGTLISFALCNQGN